MSISNLYYTLKPLFFSFLNTYFKVLYQVLQKCLKVLPKKPLSSTLTPYKSTTYDKRVALTLSCLSVIRATFYVALLKASSVFLKQHFIAKKSILSPLISANWR